jgi:hypothetical protein
LVETPQHQKSENAELAIAAVLCLAVSVAFLGIVIVRCHDGLDLTDEGFYLTWISNPNIYHRSATQFGFIYNPLYQFLNHDLALLRQSNVLVTMCLGWLPIWLLLGGHGIGKFQRAAFAIALSSSVLLVLHHMWLPTPSYNWLNLQGLLISFSGLLLILRSRSFSGQLLSGALLGVGALLIALAKPTSAIALAIVFLGVFAWEVRNRSRQLLISAASAVVVAIIGGVIAAFAIDGSILAFVERLRLGAELGLTLGVNAGHKTKFTYQILRWDRFDLPRQFGYWAGAILALSASYVVLCYSATAKLRVVRSIGLAVITIAAFIVVIWPEAISLSSNTYYVYVLPAILVGTSIGALIATRGQNGLAPYGSIFVCLCAIPFVHAVGTTNNIWLQMSQAFVFWVSAALVLLLAVLADENRTRVIAGLSLAVAATSAILVTASMEYPYRQTAPLRTHQVPVLVDVHSKRPINVTRETAEFIAELRSAASQGDMRSLLDISGRHPAAAYLAGAVAPGTPWMLGGYRNSVEFFHAVLSTEPCEQIAASWILAAPPGAKQSIPASVLAYYGMDLGRDFQLVATLSSPWYKTQLGLWRPSRPLFEGATACKEARGFDTH